VSTPKGINGSQRAGTASCHGWEGRRARGSTLPWGIAIDGDDTVWVFNVGATKVDIGGPPPPAPDRTSNWKLDADPFLNPFVIAIGAPPRRSRRR
jgi:hypothetical protein